MSRRPSQHENVQTCMYWRAERSLRPRTCAVLPCPVAFVCDHLMDRRGGLGAHYPDVAPAKNGDPVQVGDEPRIDRCPVVAVPVQHPGQSTGPTARVVRTDCPDVHASAGGNGREREGLQDVRRPCVPIPVSGETSKIGTDLNGRCTTNGSVPWKRNPPL
jgi:hypothetical protein